MEEIRKALANKGVDLDELDIREWGDSLHIVLVKEDEEDSDVEFYTTVVFPTQDMFIKTLQYIDKKKECWYKNKPDWLSNLAKLIREYQKESDNLELLGTYLYSTGDCDEHTEEFIEKMNELEEKTGAETYYAMVHINAFFRLKGLHTKHVFSNIDELVPNSKLSKIGNNIIFIDKDADNQYWHTPLECFYGSDFENFIHALTEEEQVEALKEIAEAEEKYEAENNCFGYYLSSMPMCRKALSLVVKEIAENY